MTSEQSNPAPGDVRYLTVHGAWQGAAGDPQRVFGGTVTASGHPHLACGERVTVRYHVEGGRVPDAGEHGAYALIRIPIESGSFRFNPSGCE
ncbi:hypothetical protein [Deinococcus wulumuqiensis]|uniref:Uncharacterized protein n=1 Tax=Deinococcus wulumuqiensis TaxID=980427 RepID=A0AAV4K5E5_9DEIO|nr:hypothetical protein [Deinococcus wulumuqiensis]QII21584.1 hypothetical protein G6R31_13285 [Deinococcus wulumuqiensis R12]GGI83691.1 hypothetical protein GCM10010914_17550 [Deinococcus wulumuqiensis]GGP29692.1 hypothetical protein GCM10008021_13430 [Deinococcus wulumuqiensis]